MDSNTTTANNNNEKSNSLSMYLHLKCSGAREADDFLMYTYKVRRCSKNRSHDWTECPYAHRGEKARRRDPRKFPYTGVACPEYRQSGECRRGQNCEFAHGVFEFWLHPSRYRTRVCEAGLLCPRKVCFFAHSPDELRPEVLPECRPMRDFAAAVVTTDAKEKEKKKKKKEKEEEEELELPDIDWVLDLVS